MLINFFLLLIAAYQFTALTRIFYLATASHAHITDMTIRPLGVCIWALCLSYLIAYGMTELPLLLELPR